MAAEAEAAREARAKIIRASGEEKATKALRQAADELASHPSALQLRYLQVNAQAEPYSYRGSRDIARYPGFWGFPRQM